MTSQRNLKKRFFLLFLFALAWVFYLLPSFSQEPQTTPKEKLNLLDLLGIVPPAESVDYIQDKTQFQLHTLLTEQRHRKTWNLSERIQKDYESGLRMLFSVDEDIVDRLTELAQEEELFEMAIKSIQDALLYGHKIYVYGCGATGRLAKQMESTFWRPFWKDVKDRPKIWPKVGPRLGGDIEDRLIGEMTGADRALISSLEGFEDLQLIGRLQLEDRGVKKGDVVICVTEGGETSSVIGTILAALDQWKNERGYSPERSRKNLFFVYNNPDERLLPFERSRKVLEEPGITKINLTTGPQAITGSTRMQATTIETFVIGHVLQAALDRTLRQILSKKDMSRLGFRKPIRLRKKLGHFGSILDQIKDTIPDIAAFTRMEAETYEAGHFSTYFAQKGLITVFIDSTERSPTFRLYPLDTVEEESRKSWIQVWTPAPNLQQAWQAFLGRPFRGLSSDFYKIPFEVNIEDPYLQRAALESLKKAGDSQQFLYDFSFSPSNIKTRSPGSADIGVLALLTPEEEELKNPDSPFRRFIDLCQKKGSKLSLVFITEKSRKDIQKILKKIPGFNVRDKNTVVVVRIKDENDPFRVDQQIALKVLLNAHSTGVMARLGKVIGNTMTNVSPSNLKLIGRATYLIQSHVNDVLSRPDWVKLYGIRKPISYGEANAVLFDSIDYLQDKRQEAGQTAEVALTIIRILEALRQNRGLTSEEAFAIVKETGLSQYLSDVSSQSR
jgi:N-acetylmuramic acid 6-phosphate (MurNAc-6-P) etherase